MRQTTQNSKVIKASAEILYQAFTSPEALEGITFEPVDNNTKVTFLFKDIPPGIRPEDNEAGTISSLEKLANFVE